MMIRDGTTEVSLERMGRKDGVDLRWEGQTP